MNDNKHSYLDVLRLSYDSTLNAINSFALEAVKDFLNAARECNRTSVSTEVCGIYQLIEGLSRDCLIVKAERLSGSFIHTAQKTPTPQQIKNSIKQNHQLRSDLLKESKKLFVLHFNEDAYGSFERFDTLTYLRDEALGLMGFTGLFVNYVHNLELIGSAETELV